MDELSISFLKQRVFGKTCNKKIVVEKLLAMFSVGCMLKYKSQVCREIQNRPVSSQYDLLLPPNAE